METRLVRERFLSFFQKRGHTIIPSASLLPENDPTVLFTTAGMHPLVPYLLGETHPGGVRLADSQKCLRTDDIEEVGDNRHLTFFEMLGNWSLGDYFKVESITWSFELLTSEEGFGLDPRKIFVTVFEGDTDAPRDEESIALWKERFAERGITAEVGIAEQDEPTSGENGSRIYAYPKKKNWWGPAGQTGPCGPDTEIFYDTGAAHDPAFGPVCHPNCDCGRFVEIWNNVFMQYDKREDGAFVPLAQKNVDTGMGLERMAAILQGKRTVFETDAFARCIALIEEVSGIAYYAEDMLKARPFRIIADHMRAATFVIGDPRGVVPSNVGQGYIVRRLLRRAIREAKRLGIGEGFVRRMGERIIEEYGAAYPELRTNQERIVQALEQEEQKFSKTLEKGLREFEKLLAKGAIGGAEAFLLFSSYGFPLELTEELLRERGLAADRALFQEEFRKHQELSRASAGTFKGGLADDSVASTRLHTATHLLHQALRTVLGPHVAQKGSNITPERLRFDFSHPQKLTPEELVQVEAWVNAAITKDVPMTCDVMTVEEAKASGAIGLFEDTYAQMGGNIKVYTAGDLSKEVCGGPHVTHTGELGSFKILKEEAVSAGVRRIKASVTGG